MAFSQFDRKSVHHFECNTIIRSSEGMLNNCQAFLKYWVILFDTTIVNWSKLFHSHLFECSYVLLWNTHIYKLQKNFLGYSIPQVNWPFFFSVETETSKGLCTQRKYKLPMIKNFWQNIFHVSSGIKIEPRLWFITVIGQNGVKFSM